MMKNFFLFALISFAFFACTTQESIEELEEINGGVSLGPPQSFQCDPNWIAPVVEPGDGVVIYNSIGIYYDEDLTLEEVNCIRQEYFTRYACLKMSLLQPTDPYEDTWVIICPKTEGAGIPDTSSNEDERVCINRPMCR